MDVQQFMTALLASNRFRGNEERPMLLLFMLWESEKQTQTVHPDLVTRVLGHSPAATTRAVNVLLRKELIRSIPTKSDRRRFDLTITDAGKRKLKEYMETLRKVVEANTT